MESDETNTQGTPDGNEEADSASGGAPEKPDAPDSTKKGHSPDTTDENDRPVDNPSGG